MPAPLLFESKIRGVSGLREMFEQVDSQVRRNVRSRLIALGQRAAGVARGNAPVGETGQLKGSIRTQLREKGATVAVRVFVDQPKEPYGYFLEFGAVSHGTKHNKRRRGGKKKRIEARRALMEAGQWRLQPRPWFGYARADVVPQVPGALNEAVQQAVNEVQR